jgi:hypothetical protein
MRKNSNSFCETDHIITDREPPGSHLKSAPGGARSVKSARFSPWEKLSAEQTGESLMVVIKAPHGSAFYCHHQNLIRHATHDTFFLKLPADREPPGSHLKSAAGAARSEG